MVSLVYPRICVQSGIGHYSVDQVIDDGSNVVDAAQPVIERGLLLGLHNRPPSVSVMLLHCLVTFARPSSSWFEILLIARHGQCDRRATNRQLGGLGSFVASGVARGVAEEA